MNYTICPEKTAISNGYSKSAKYIVDNIDKDKKILDYGAGKLRNAKFLKSKGYDISVLDTELQISKWSNLDKNDFNIYSPDNIYIY